MPKKCCFSGCKNYQTTCSGRSFFSFPKDPTARNLWLSRCPEGTNTKFGRICSDHFSTEDFREPFIFSPTRPRLHLRKNAIPNITTSSGTSPSGECKFFETNSDPTMCLSSFCEIVGSDSESVSSLSDWFESKEEQTNNQKVSDVCIVDGCKNRSLKRNELATFFFFPRDIKLKRVWVQACKKKSRFDSKRAKICNLHFSADQLYVVSTKRKPKPRLKLTKNAVPNIYLDAELESPLVSQAKFEVQDYGKILLPDALSSPNKILFGAKTKSVM